MKKKELNVEKLEKVSGGKQSSYGCEEWQKAKDKPADHSCGSCYYWVQDEKALGLKYKCFLGYIPIRIKK